MGEYKGKKTKIHYQLRGLYLIQLALNETKNGVWKRNRSQSKNWGIIKWLGKRYDIDQTIISAMVDGYISISDQLKVEDIKKYEFNTQTFLFPSC